MVWGGLSVLHFGMEWERLERLGGGVTGEVFAANHPVFGRCAAKVIKVRAIHSRHAP